MIRKTASFAIAGLGVLGMVSETAAGGRAVECYERVHTPATYETVYEKVLVRPGGQLVHAIPAIIGTRERVVPVSPNRVSYEIVPAITRTIYHTVKVDGGGYSWEWRVIHGRKVRCKVWHKARNERVAETVVVQPAWQRRVVAPAEFEGVAEEVVVQPSYVHTIDIPPSYRTIARRVVVNGGSPAWRRVHIPDHCRY
jgi:hypothetical protein